MYHLYGWLLGIQNILIDFFVFELCIYPLQRSVVLSTSIKYLSALWQVFVVAFMGGCVTPHTIISLAKILHK